MRKLGYTFFAVLCAVLVIALLYNKRKADEAALLVQAENVVAEAEEPARPCGNPYEAKVVFSGPGGHSNGAYGRTSAIHAAGTAVESMFLSESPAGVTYNVNTFFGGNSVNSIAGSATLIIESCADTPEASAEFVKFLQDNVDKGVAFENEFRGIKPGQTDSAGVRMDIRAEIVKL